MKQLFGLLVIFLSINSCTNSTGQKQHDLLQGTWHFETGHINGSSTDASELLNKTVLEFTKDSMYCNLFGGDTNIPQKQAYLFEQNSITTKSDLKLIIDTLTENSLTLSFDLTFGTQVVKYQLNLKN